MIILMEIIVPIMLMFFGASWLIDIFIDFMTLSVDDSTDIKQVEVVNPHDFYIRRS